MGFSFGSVATHSAIAAKPNIADAVVLTAIGFNPLGLNINGLVRSFVPRIANLQNPRLYGDRDTGYITWVDKFAQIHKYVFTITRHIKLTVHSAISKSLIMISQPQISQSWPKNHLQSLNS